MAIGAVGAWAITWGMFTLVDSKLQAATYTTLLCTVWSFFRCYLVRRYFNKLWSK